MKILLVEDDEGIAEPLIEALVDQDYVVDPALDGEVAWTLSQTYAYDRPVHLQSHRGRITVKSRLGAGSCFQVELSRCT
jgi:DNA-binding response OmpR family regulator